MMSRHFANKPEDLDLRLSSSLEDLIPHDEKAEHMEEDIDQTLYLVLKDNQQIYENIDQLHAKIKLLEEQLIVNNTLIYHTCPHEWVNNGYDIGCDRPYKVCKHCNLPTTY